MLRKIYFNFSANTAATIIHLHVFIKLCDSIVISSGTDVKHECIFRLKVLADALEEPLMRVNLTIVTLLQSKNEIDSSTVKLVSVFEAKVPSAYLEQMEHVCRDVFSLDIVLHQLLHSLHSPFSLSFLNHVSFSFQEIFIKEFVFSGKLFKGIRNPIETITNTDYYQILLPHFQIRIFVHSVVVLQNSGHGRLQLRFVLIVHRNADGQLREGLV